MHNNYVCEHIVCMFMLPLLFIRLYYTLYVKLCRLYRVCVKPWSQEARYDYNIMSPVKIHTLSTDRSHHRLPVPIPSRPTHFIYCFGFFLLNGFLFFGIYVFFRYLKKFLFACCRVQTTVSFLGCTFIKCF